MSSPSDPSAPKARLLVRFVFDPERDDAIGTFFPDEPADAARFYALLGRILALWGRIEVDLAMLIAQTVHLDGVPELVEVPVSLKKRLAFLRRAFQSAPDLGPFRPQADHLFPTLGETGRRRNLLVHSLFWGFSDTAPRAAQFYKLRKEPGGADPFLRLTEKDLAVLMGEIGSLGTQLMMCRVSVRLHLRGLGKERPTAA